MTSHDEGVRVVSATREIAAGAAKVFEFIVDPTQQPRWDGNDNLAEAPGGQRIRALSEVFTMTTKGNIRENHVVEFVEGCSSPSTRHIRVSRTPTTGPD